MAAFSAQECANYVKHAGCASKRPESALDAKYRDLWARSLPREMLYQLAIYALSKSTGAPRSTILYPTLDADAVDQTVLLKDPALGHKRAEIMLRPVNLLELETLIRPRQSPLIARTRRKFAHTMVTPTTE
jgi:5-methylcytosine-specific restriction enzyme subunit McrC